VPHRTNPYNQKQTPSFRPVSIRTENDREIRRVGAGRSVRLTGDLSSNPTGPSVAVAHIRRSSTHRNGALVTVVINDSGNLPGLIGLHFEQTDRNFRPADVVEKRGIEMATIEPRFLDHMGAGCQWIVGFRLIEGPDLHTRDASNPTGTATEKPC
jgi:hypothetical protein